MGVHVLGVTQLLSGQTFRRSFSSKTVPLPSESTDEERATQTQNRPS
jgi:hypothetical protein